MQRQLIHVNLQSMLNVIMKKLKLSCYIHPTLRYLQKGVFRQSGSVFCMINPAPVNFTTLRESYMAIRCLPERQIKNWTNHE